MILIEPLVSVIMPVYNAREYIRDAIESILNQTYSNWELILVLDCPTDETEKCILDFDDPRIRLERNDENRGIAYSRNKGIAIAKGKYIALLDDDDKAYPDRISHQVSYLEIHSEIGAVGGRTTFMDEEGKTQELPNVVYFHPEENKIHLLFRNVLMNGTMMMRSEIIRDNNLNYEDGCYGMEDFRFWVNFSKIALITNLDEPVLFYRMHERNESSKVKALFLEQKIWKYAEIQAVSLELNDFELSEEDKSVIRQSLCEVHSAEYSYSEYNQVYMLLKKLKQQCADNNKVWRLEFERICGQILDFIFERTILPGLDDFGAFSEKCLEGNLASEFRDPYLVKQDKGLEFFLQTEQSFHRQYDAAVFVHLYYKEQKEQSYTYIRRACRVCDVYITTPTQEVAEYIRECCNKEKLNNCYVQLVENRGQDIASLVVHHVKKIKSYKYFCFVHDKKSAHITSENAEIWYKTLWENTIADEGYMEQAINLLRDNENIGLLAVPTPFWGEFVSMVDNGWADAYEATNALANKLSLNSTVNREYPPIALGTAFWAKTDALSDLWNAEFSLECFPEAGVGMQSYAIERILPYIALNHGYDTGIIQTTGFAAYRMNQLQKSLAKSMNVLKNRFSLHDEITLTRFSDDYDRLKKIICMFEKTYIYGTGAKAVKCIQKFPELLQYIDGFVRTEGVRENEGFFGKPVYDAEFVINEKTLFLVAINGEDAEEVFRYMLKKGASPNQITSIIQYCDWLT